jgi:4-amino-4-deoxychorismate lyase
VDERDNSVVVLLDGTVGDPSAPLLRADDLGILRGDGVFESVLAVDGHAWNLDKHLSRLGRSAAMLDLPAPAPEAWRSCVATAIGARRREGETRLRLILTRGSEGSGEPTGYVLADAVDPEVVRARTEGVRVVTLATGIDAGLAERAPWLLLGAKTLSYAVNMAAQRWAHSHDADDAIFVTRDGSILEAPTASVVTASGRRLASPPPSTGILPGTTVASIFSAAAAAGWEAGFHRLTVDDLLGADGVWLVSSIRLAARVSSLDGTSLPGVELDPQISGFAHLEEGAG